jgi:hypothetical protein
MGSRDIEAGLVLDLRNVLGEREKLRAEVFLLYGFQ